MIALLVACDIKTERVLTSKTCALTCVAGLGIEPQTERSQVGYREGTTALVDGFGARTGCVREAADPCFPLTLIFSSHSPSVPLL